MATTVLTNETIESVINALPIQGRIMLRLLLLQYLDTTPEDVEFIATDRPDPRFASGGKPFLQVIARETLQGITDRIAQYRNRNRQNANRPGCRLTACGNRSPTVKPYAPRPSGSCVNGSAWIPTR